MKMYFVVVAAVAGVFLTTAGNAEADEAEGAQLSTDYKCQTCHAVEKKLVGPAFKEIAKKYAGDKAALGKLQASIKVGSKGVWGPIPMPPNSVPDADLQKLGEWILSLK